MNIAVAASNIIIPLRTDTSSRPPTVVHAQRLDLADAAHSRAGDD